MSWFSSSKSYVNVDEKIDEATSESVPNGDIDFAAALEITDMIRSKQVSSKDAMRSLKKRFINNKNPNTQKSALKLIDFCIKNGGEHFLTQISSKEFMDPLVGTVKDKRLNNSVKDYLLELIQSWSIMLSTNPKYIYVNQTYNKLQKEGNKFPVIQEYIDTSLVESRVAPEWEDSDACMLCSNMFTFINRKHHCRSCGGVFCGQHSSKSCELPELGITIPVRVCDTCYQEHKDKKIKNKKHRHSGHGRKRSTSKPVSGVEDDEDEALKRAIELSLADTTIPITDFPPNGPSRPNPTENQDDDEEMKAAIAASLADFQQQSHQQGKSSVASMISTPAEHSGLYSNLLPNIDSRIDNNSSTFDQPLPAVESQVKQQESKNYNLITGVEQQNILLFAQMLNNIEKMPVNMRRPISEDIALNNLRNNLVKLRPKIGAELSEQRANLEVYEDLYSKLFAIAKVYAEIGESRLHQNYQYQPQYAPGIQPYKTTLSPQPVQPQPQPQIQSQTQPQPQIQPQTQPQVAPSQPNTPQFNPIPSQKYQSPAVEQHQQPLTSPISSYQPSYPPVQSAISSYKPSYPPSQSQHPSYLQPPPVQQQISQSSPYTSPGQRYSSIGTIQYAAIPPDYTAGTNDSSLKSSEPPLHIPTTKPEDLYPSRKLSELPAAPTGIGSTPGLNVASYPVSYANVPSSPELPKYSELPPSFNPSSPSVPAASSPVAVSPAQQKKPQLAVVNLIDL